MIKNILLTSIIPLVVFFTNDYAWTNSFWLKMGIFFAIGEVIVRVIGPLLNAVIFMNFFDLKIVKDKPLPFMMVISLVSALTDSIDVLVIIVLAVLLNKAYKTKDNNLRILMIFSMIILICVSVWAIYT